MAALKENDTRQVADYIVFLNNFFKTHVPLPHAATSEVRFACPMRTHRQLGLVVRCGELALPVEKVNQSNVSSGILRHSFSTMVRLKFDDRVTRRNEPVVSVRQDDGSV